MSEGNLKVRVVELTDKAWTAERFGNIVAVLESKRNEAKDYWLVTLLVQQP